MPAYLPDPDVDPIQLVEDLGAAIADIYNGIEVRLQQEVARRLYNALEVYPDLLERLRLVGELRELTQNVVGAIDTEDLARRLIEIAVAQGTAAAVAQLNLAPNLSATLGLAPTSVNAAAMLAMDLTNKLEALHLRILRYPDDVYQFLVAQLAPHVLLGSSTRLATHKLLVNQFLQEGIRIFTDRGGRNWRIGSYAEMAVRTATSRAWSDAGIYRMQQSGLNAVDPIVGRTACERCMAWAGKTLSTDGTPAGFVLVPHAYEDRMVPVYIDATLEYARSQGFQHPNCTCQCAAHFAGLPVFADATTFNPEANAAQTRQRELERAKREAKRQVAIASDAAARAEAMADLRDANTALQEHTATTGVIRRYYREQLPFADGGPVNARVPR